MTDSPQSSSSPPDRPDRPDRPHRPHRSVRSDRLDRPDRSARPDRPGRTGRSNAPDSREPAAAREPIDPLEPVDPLEVIDQPQRVDPRERADRREYADPPEPADRRAAGDARGASASPSEGAYESAHAGDGPAERGPAAGGSFGSGPAGTRSADRSADDRSAEGGSAERASSEGASSEGSSPADAHAMGAQSMSWGEFFDRIKALTRTPDGPGGVDSGLRHRLRLAVSSLLLVTAAFSIAPGKIISDTKLDMAINPAAFMARALHLWDANEHFGQLQNQAYGYLFPMGPFYLLGELIGLAPWVTQRLWVAAVLCAAFIGVVKLAELLDIGSPNARLLAGFAYALAPRAQELVAINSSEFLPTAILPWILIPLVKGSASGSPRRAAALSALAMVLCGGINGTAELAVLVVPLVYLLTRKRGPRKWRLLGWWLPGVALATFWWIVPLMVMGRYGFKFIDYVESAGTTTQTTSMTNILRGASNWVGYVPVDGLPWWPAGYTLSTSPTLIAVTGLVAGLGLFGLCRAGLPERTFLVLSLLLGVAIIVTGHRSAIAPPFSEEVRALFDGVLAPFRNIHKFDALVRLPLALGIAHLIVSPMPKWRPVLTLITIGAVAGSFIPVLSAGLAARGSFKDIPDYWREAATWVNRNAGENTVLAVPGARFGEYTWGRPIDEPMQPLLKARWSSRMIVPWGSAGLARLMEGIDERFASGRGSPGLTQVLSRMGVRFLLVRNDLDQTTTRGAWPARVHEALRESLGPEAKPVREFGPSIGAAFNADATTSVYQPYKALEIYEVPRAAALVNTVTTERPLRVTGGPESLLTLADQGLLADDRPVLFNDDGDAPDIPSSDTIVTDTLRRREVSFADTHRGSSPTMTESDRYRGSSKVKDLVEPGWDQYSSLARLYGIRNITASSSASDITSLPESRTAGQQPYAAMDGDQRTYWTSGGWYGAEGEWLRVQFRQPIRLDRINLAFKQNPLYGPPVSEVTIETEQGSAPRQPVKANGDPQTLETPSGPSDWLRVKVTKLAYKPKRKLGTRVAISELSVPGLATGRAIVTPPLRNTPSGTGSPAVALTGQTGSSEACMLGSRSWACSQQLDIKGEDGNAFDRVFTVARTEPTVISGTAVLSDPRKIEEYTTFGQGRINASSSIAEHPAALGRSAFDGDRSTTWIADPLERQPSLSLELGKRVTLSQLKFVFPYETAPAPATQVVVAAEKQGDLRTGWIGRDGVLNFAPVRTNRLLIKFLQGGSPVQITEMEVTGVEPYQAPRGLKLKTVCGTGPRVLIDGWFPVATRLVSGTIGDLLDGRPVPFESCGGEAKPGASPEEQDLAEPVIMPAGARRFQVPASDPYRIAGAVIRPAAVQRPAKATVEPMQVNHWTAEVRSVSVRTTRESYLIVNDNYNVGWEARLDGKPLRAVRLDGWRQAWILPANVDAEVEMRYVPDLPYRIGLLGGFLLIMLLVVIAVLPARPTGRGTAAPAAGAIRVLPGLTWIIAPALGLWAGGVYGLVGVVGILAVMVRARTMLDRGLSPPMARVARAVGGSMVSGILIALAASAMAVGTFLSARENYTLADPLRDAVPQLLCLLLLGRLVWTLREPPKAAAATAGGSATVVEPVTPSGTDHGTDPDDDPDDDPGSGPAGGTGRGDDPDPPRGPASATGARAEAVADAPADRRTGRHGDHPGDRLTQPRTAGGAWGAEVPRLPQRRRQTDRGAARPDDRDPRMRDPRKPPDDSIDEDVRSEADLRARVADRFRALGGRSTGRHPGEDADAPDAVAPDDGTGPDDPAGGGGQNHAPARWRLGRSRPPQSQGSPHSQGPPQSRRRPQPPPPAKPSAPSPPPSPVEPEPPRYRGPWDPPE